MKISCRNPWFDEKFLVHLRSFSEKRVNLVISKVIARATSFSQKSYNAEKQAAAAHSIRTGIKTTCTQRLGLQMLWPPRIPLEQGLRLFVCSILCEFKSAATYSIRTGIKTRSKHRASSPFLPPRIPLEQGIDQFMMHSSQCIIIVLRKCFGTDLSVLRVDYIGGKAVPFCSNKP